MATMSQGRRGALACWASVAFALAPPLFAATPTSATPSLKCDIGPAKQTYGGTRWLVFSCDDGKSIVVVTDTGNPAAPFYFLLSPDGSGYVVHGEGNGDKGASDAAGDELSRLSTEQVGALIAETRSAGSSAVAK